MTIYTMMSAAKVVKARTGRAMVNYNEDEHGASPAASMKRKPMPAKAKAAKAPPTVVTGGKARKTGFVLARAKLGTATSELAATRDRQSALLAKGAYREADKVGREAPTGTLQSKAKPKRKEAESLAAHKAAFQAWMKQTFGGKVKQVNTASAYERMVLSANMWMVEQGYEAFCRVVEVTPQRYKVELIADEGGVPRTPEVEAVVEFLTGMAEGDVLKGGSREAREKDWYASSLWGRSQAEQLMPLAKQGKYGWGAHKDKPFRLGRIEQHVTALRQWLKEKLLTFDVEVVNPMHSGWIDAVMGQLTNELGRGRDESRLPPRLTDAVFASVMEHADLDDAEEVQTVGYLGKNGVHGSRAHDNWWLDREDALKLPANTDTGQRPGFKVKHVSTKNNKAQASRPKALACRTSCEGCVALTAEGKLDTGKLCSACLFELPVAKVDAKLGADEETKKNGHVATLPTSVTHPAMSAESALSTANTRDARPDGEAGCLVQLFAPKRLGRLRRSQTEEHFERFGVIERKIAHADVKQGRKRRRRSRPQPTPQNRVQRAVRRETDDTRQPRAVRVAPPKMQSRALLAFRRLPSVTRAGQRRRDRPRKKLCANLC